MNEEGKNCSRGVDWEQWFVLSADDSTSQSWHVSTNSRKHQGQPRKHTSIVYRLNERYGPRLTLGIIRIGYPDKTILRLVYRENILISVLQFCNEINW
jgi:hypothetical protein